MGRGEGGMGRGVESVRGVSWVGRQIRKIVMRWHCKLAFRG